MTRKMPPLIDFANREKDDFYPTPPHATHALLDHVQFTGPIWEPACGDGAISKVLIERGHDVTSTDLIDRGYGESGADFLLGAPVVSQNIITNPPFKHANEFVIKALQSVLLSDNPGKIAMLLPMQFDEGLARKKQIFDVRPYSTRLVFSNRLTMHRAGKKTSEGSGSKAFCWFIWDMAGPPPESQVTKWIIAKEGNQ